MRTNSPIAAAIAAFLAAQSLMSQETDPMTRANTDWFQEQKWGVFVHYLTSAEMSADEWNAQVDTFDVGGLADELEAAGASFIFLTLGQNSGHYCAPNATYDRIAGIDPSKCSRRDLVADLYDELHPRGIELLVYLPSGAPAADEQAYQAFGWEWGYEGTWADGPHKVLTGDRLAFHQMGVK